MAARKKTEHVRLGNGVLNIPAVAVTKAFNAHRRVECSSDDARIESVDLFIDNTGINVIVYSVAGWQLLPDDNDGGNLKLHEEYLTFTKPYLHVPYLHIPAVQTKLVEHVRDVLKRTRRCYCTECLEDVPALLVRLQIAKANGIKAASSAFDTSFDEQIDALLEAAGADVASRGVP